MQQVRSELADLLAPAGIEARWLTAAQAQSSSVASLVSIDLRGDCDFQKKASGAFSNGSPLASTAVVDGKILPFVWVDCTGVRKFLKNSLAKASTQEKSHLAARAVARLLAHELYHVLSESEEHTESGIAKESFTSLDLIADNLVFESDAIDRLVRSDAVTAAYAEPLPASDVSLEEFDASLPYDLEIALSR